MSIWDELQHFTEGEFGPHPDALDEELLRRLDRAREIAQVPFFITDSWRPPESTIGVSNSTHKLGKAVDIRVHNSHTRFRIVVGLIKAGFNRIGIYDKHVHADVGSPDHTGQVLWIGDST